LQYLGAWICLGSFNLAKYEAAYNERGRRTVSFLPPTELMESYRKDYEVMKEQMIYGETPGFDVLIERLNTLLERFRNKG
jgi:hypothetical protein